MTLVRLLSISTISILCVILFYNSAEAKVFSKCELANKLEALKAAKEDIPTWVCIAYHESRYNSSAVGPANHDGSRDHGLFQLNDRYWCWVKEDGPAACGLPCSDFENDDIKDDFVCARRVFRAFKRRSGNGFTAWTVYAHHCASPATKDYVKDCNITVKANSCSQTAGGNSSPNGSCKTPLQLEKTKIGKNHA